MATVREVCKYFILKGIKSNAPVTQISLQKLLYFAQGIHLAKYNESLFVDPIYAWKYGPVVHSMYKHFRVFGNRAMDFQTVTEILGEEFFEDSDNLSIEEKSSLDMTWTTFGKRTPFELVRITHLDGSPWNTIVKLHGEDARDVVIPTEDMTKYFKGMMLATA